MKKEIKSGIYIIRCLKSIKVYVGSAINLEKRKFIHFNSLKKNYHCNRKLQRSFNKYSEENFKFEVLEYVSRFENESKLDFKLRLVNDREQYYLDTILFFNSRNIKYCSNICRYKNAPRLTCEYCHRTFDIGNYSLHHGNLCNLNPNKITTSCII